MLDSEPIAGLTPRGRRALALIAVAVAVIVTAGLAFLHSPVEPRSPSAAAGPPLLSTLNPIVFDFVTPTVGWAVEAANAGGSFGIFRTTDGAKHWEEQLAPGSAQIGFLLISTDFVDQRHGFVATGDPVHRLERTTDAGRHWESVPLPGAGSLSDAIAFSSPTYGWLLVGGRTSSLYSTSDAGTTWQRLPDPPSDADGLSFRGPGEAWMGSTGLGAPHVYESSDTGKTWQRLDVPHPPGQRWAGSVPTAVELLPRTGVRALVPPVAQPYLEELGLTNTFTSFDQGTSWSSVPPPPGVVGYQDSANWWAMRGTSLFKSADAGQTWAMVTNALPAWQFAPHVLDPRHAWAYTAIPGGFGLALTADGGLHWTEATVPPSAH